MTYKHELKYLINYQDYVLIKLRLRNMMPVGTSTDSDGSYTVHSLYFDDFYDRSYDDKNMQV